jgi:hypothetical protein
MMKVVNGVQMISLDVDAQTWVLIQQGLSELPYKLSASVLGALGQQVLAQTQAPAGKPPAPIEGNDSLPVA